MVLRLLIDAAHADETRVAIVDNGKINDFDYATAAKKQLKGNIYLAKITRVEPSLQAAFVEYGSGKQGFLPFSEIHPDYYQIPVADREELLKEFEDTDETGEPQISQPEIGLNPNAINAEPEPEAIFLQAEDRVMQGLHDYSDHTTEVASAEKFFLQAGLQEDGEPARGALPAVYDSPVVHDTNNDSMEAVVETADSSNIPEGEMAESEVSEVETLASEEDMVRDSHKSQSFFRRYKIQEVIKRNQIVLVQVIKEERGNKGVSLTTFISLAGRYSVLMPNSLKGGGISRKISGGEDRRRLREISADLKITRGMSAIIRTAGIDRSRAEIQRDYDYLVKLWENIREQTLASTAPALIYEEGDIIKRTIRDLYINEIEEIIVAGEASFEQAKNFLNLILPGHNTQLKLYQDNIPLFYAYNIEDQLNSMYDHVVKLRSGGYIVINPTEALISIDVNSGRATGERNIEETASKTNIEAANEIARQLRLRDLAGLIVIDFIDMADSRNRRTVERVMKDALKTDRSKIQIGRISPFGLLEMSRQRLRPSISESSTVLCSHCQGRGVVRANSSVALQIIRALEKEASAHNIGELKLYIPNSILVLLLNTRREELNKIEEKYTIRIVVLPDDSLPHGNFRIEKIKGSRRTLANTNAMEPISMENTMMDIAPLSYDEDTEITQGIVPEISEIREERPRRNKRGGRNKRRNNHGDASAVVSENNTPMEKPVESLEAENSENRPTNEERKPGRRRSRQWRDRRERNSSENATESAMIPPENGKDKYHEYDTVPAQEKQLEYAGADSYSSGALVPVLPLQDQTPKDNKPKKGWWRRIVEA